MRGIRLASLPCSIARTLDVVGERWTLLLLRDAFNGVRRFEDFATSLPIATNVLTARLQLLVRHGIMERAPYQDHPPRFEYRLTAKGRQLYPVLVALSQWGDAFLAGDGDGDSDGDAAPSLQWVHHACGRPVAAAVVCRGCGRTLTAPEVRRERRPAAAAQSAAEAAGPEPA